MPRNFYIFCANEHNSGGGVKKLKVAIATVGKKGLDDEVADTFAQANTFTLLFINGNRVHIEVLDNPAASLTRGRGITIVPLLKEKGVNVVVASKLGLGASVLLEKAKIRMVLVSAGTKVVDIVREGIYKKSESFKPKF
jgi:predicted Fe-Mo cluster-binding NifX family protein